MKARIAALALVLLVGLSAAAILDPSAGAQQADKVPRIGMLVGGPAQCPRTSMTGVFLEGLAASGYVEGLDFVLDRRCYPKDDLAKTVVMELLKQKPTILLAGGGVAARAMKGVTTIPVVFAGVADPVGSGLVQSLARPGTNMTGQTDITTALHPKRLEILKEALPSVSRVALLGDPNDFSYRFVVRESEVAAQALGVRLRYFSLGAPLSFRVRSRR